MTSLAVSAAPFAGVLGYVAIIRLVGATRIPAPAIAWVGFGLWVIGLVVTLVTAITISNDTGWSLYTPETIVEPPSTHVFRIAMPLAVGGAALIYAVHLAVIVAFNARAEKLRVAIATVLVFAIGGGGLAIASMAVTVLPTTWISAFTVMIGTMFATAALGGERKIQHVLVAIGFALAIVWAMLPMLVVALALAGIWIALAIVGDFGRPAVAFVVFGCLPAIVMRGFASGVSSDLPLHDTYFEVARVHLVSAAVGFAALAGLHAWPVMRRVPNTIVAWSGACVCSGGLLLHIYAQLGVGSAGMPRRYWDYDPQFTTGHVLSLVGTVVLAIGIVVLTVAWLVGRPPRSAVIIAPATGSG